MSLPRYHCATPLSIYSSPFPFSFLPPRPSLPFLEKKLHRRESNPGHKRERLVCYQLHHNGLLTYPLTPPLMPWPLSTIIPLLTLYLWEVSWCSWLSHHFYVVRVPGSNPGGTIFTILLVYIFSYFFIFLPYLAFFVFIIGRFISSRIHPFPSEHGSKDA